MVPVALTVLAAASATALLALRRRRSRRSQAGGERITPVRAGVQHLATTLTDLSDGGFHLRAAPARARRPRLGTLLGLR
jgi:hypothetical protein